MKMTRRNLNFLIENYLNEDTKKLESTLIDFLQKNSSFLKQELNISKKMLIVLGHTAIAISGRESSYGEGNRYEKTDWAEGLMSSIAYNLGIETYGIRQYSIGPTQMKYGTADSEIPDNVKEKIGLTGPGDLRDDLKALLATVAVLASNYNKAKLKGYSTNTADDISASKNHEKANKLFVSTGNAALDMAVTGYNTGSGKIKNYGKGKNYIPCYGPYCSGNSGVATYGYVATISKYFKSKSINGTE